MGEEVKLEPCPFCGGRPEKRLGVGEWWVSCPTCDSHSKGCSNYDAAIAAWNRRAPRLSKGEGLGECTPERAAIATAPQAVAPSAVWRPIETAPKGRTLLVGYRTPLGKWRTLRATYYPPGTLEAGDSLLDNEVDEDGYAPEGWYEESDTHDELMPLDRDPTHWMPLPEPPGSSTPGDGLAHMRSELQAPIPPQEESPSPGGSLPTTEDLGGGSCSDSVSEHSSATSGGSKLEGEP